MAYFTKKYAKMELPRGFKKPTMAEVHAELIAISKEILRVAKEEDLDIFPVYGTMLGIARHNGKIIPWDDDVDLVINSFEKRKIWEVLTEKLPNWIGVTPSWDEWPGFGVYSKRFNVINTTYFEKGRLGSISVDIFEYTNVKKKRHWRKIRNALALLFIRKSRGGGAQRLARIIVSVFTRKFYEKLYVGRLKKFACREGEHEMIIEDDGKFIKGRVFSGENKEVEFEGFKIKIPSNYEEHLINEYGNWMQLPSDTSENVHIFGMKKNKE